jgi:NhaA family Na+:H+ antiporter
MLARPLREFLETEAASGVILLAAVLLALAWANSPWRDGYVALWHTEVRVAVADHELAMSLRHWVNDGLMVVFFFVIGLEVKRELVVGELSSARSAALPAVAAVGGMAVLAGLYLLLNAGGPGARGWGIPMATDTAFALALLALVGSRAPQGLRVLLLSLAIVDDIGAIIVIAAFYTAGIHWPAMAVAAGLLGVVVVLGRWRVWWVPIYVLIGAGVWLATLQAGVHPTIAGVALALLTPARPLQAGDVEQVPLLRQQDVSPHRGIRPEQARIAVPAKLIGWCELDMPYVYDSARHRLVGPGRRRPSTPISHQPSARGTGPRPAWVRGGRR